MFKRLSKATRIVIFLIVAILILSSTVFAVYKCYTLGNDKLRFNLIVSNANENPTVVNPPKLVDGMIPIKWDSTQSKWIVTSATSAAWYNYDANVKRWANVMLSDGKYNSETAKEGMEIEEADLGSMFVWIPRYEYKINYTDASTIASGGTIDIKFINSEAIIPSSGYTIHPAFRSGENSNYENGEWSSEIDGFWMSKFEMSKETYDISNSTWSTAYADSSSLGDITIDNTTTRIASKPNKEMWTHISINKAYLNSKLATYNLGNSASLVNSHMLKNSEWGAVAYLGYSEFGKGSQPYNNNYMLSSSHLLSGFSSGSTTMSVTWTVKDANRYSDQTVGVGASCTGTIYGVYDMNGGTNEFTAAYMNGGTALDPSPTGNEKYFTVYTAGSMLTNGKIGDATKETYSWDNNSVGDGSGPKNFTTSNYFMRGGGPTNGNAKTTSGLFSFYTSNGANDSFYRGFRTALVVE